MSDEGPGGYVMGNYLGQPEPPPPPPIPEKVEGLETSGAMGTRPALTVSSVMALVAFIVLTLGQLHIWEPTGDMLAFAESYGFIAAGVLVGAYQLINGLITQAHVFAPNSVAKRFVAKYRG